MHLHGDRAIALAGFAAAAGNVEGKMPRREAAPLSVGRSRKDLAYGIEGLQVGGGVGARSAADRRLVEQNNLFNERIALDTVAQFLEIDTGALGFECFVEDVIDQRRFAGTGDPGHGDHGAEREHDVDIAQVMRARAFHTDHWRARRAAVLRNLNLQVLVQISAGERLRHLLELLIGRGGHHAPTVFSRAGPQVKDVVSRAHHFRIVLHHQNRVS